MVNIPIVPILRVAGVGCAGVLIIVAIINFIGIITYDKFDVTIHVKGLVMCVYQVVFAILIILAEMRVVQLLAWFPFLTKSFGIGLFYIFVAVFSVGGGAWYNVTITILFIVVGVVYLILPCACQSEQTEVERVTVTEVSSDREEKSFVNLGSK